MENIERFFLDGFITCKNLIIDSDEISENGKLRIEAITLLITLQFHKVLPDEHQIRKLQLYINRWQGDYANQMKALIERTKEKQ
jgi:hypothetical protein